MKTKNILIIAAAVMAMSIVFSSCNKYEEGPAFTIVSVNKRIEGTWVLKETKVNDTVVNLNDLSSMLGNVDMDSIAGDIPFDISDITVTAVKLKIEKDGDGNFYFAINAGFFPVTRTEYITWVFDDKKENIDITIMSEILSFEILRLTTKELWIRNVETTDGVSTTLVMKMEKEKD